MIFRSPISVIFTPTGGEAVEILGFGALSNAAPNFDGELEVFSTSLIDSQSSFAEGLGSATESRSYSWFKWFLSAEEMIAASESFAWWAQTNQNGKLLLKDGEGRELVEFEAAISGYHVAVDNVVAPDDGREGYLCLSFTLDFTLANRQNLITVPIF